MKRIFKILLFSLISVNVFGSAQIPDLIIYNGDTLSLYSCPLYSYPNQDLITPQGLFGGRGCFFSACLRNNVATWEIIDGKLYLCEIRNACYPTSMRGVSGSYKSGVNKESIGNEYADLKVLFPQIFKDGKVKADWVDGKMVSPQGKLLHYVHMGFQSIYEKELELDFSNGKLIGTKTYDNSKTRQSELSKNSEKLKDFVYSHIDWESLPKCDDKTIRVVLQFSANENGIVDSVKVIKGYDGIFDNEAIRVIKAIPDWDVYYRHGKPQRINFSFPVVFNDENRNKYRKENNVK